MPTTEDIVDWALTEFGDLADYGFSNPLVRSENFKTKIGWLHEKIGIEVVLDWRDLDVSGLIVKLEDGNLPDGYFVSDGKRCRVYLQRAIRENGWPVDQEALALIGRRQVPVKDTKLEHFFTEITAYKIVLMVCLDKILTAESKLLFPEKS